MGDWEILEYDRDVPYKIWGRTEEDGWVVAVTGNEPNDVVHYMEGTPKSYEEAIHIGRELTQKLKPKG